MNYTEQHFRGELSARIDAEMAAAIQRLAEGYARNFDEYRERVGYISALRDVLGWCESITEDMGMRKNLV